MMHDIRMSLTLRDMRLDVVAIEKRKGLWFWNDDNSRSINAPINPAISPFTTGKG